MTNKLLRNLKFECSWNGKDFSGFQIQPHARTIESALNKAWQILVGKQTDNTPLQIEAHKKNITPERTIGCSRLDAGVHAYRYVFNIYSHTKFSTNRIVTSLNGILKKNLTKDICIYSCQNVDLNFHARFSATGKHYQYLVWHGQSEHIDFRYRAWHIKTQKSLENLESILKSFEGTHNFNSFRANDCGSKNPVKSIYKIEVKKHKDFPELHIIDIFGNGFLKNMIRNIIGMGMLVVNAKKDVTDISTRLATGKKDYNLCAPAYGLTLMNVYYQDIVH